jgi:hypothetical protein
MSYILRSNFGKLRKMTEQGIQKLIRNVKSLKQNLTNVSFIRDKESLDLASQYYELFLFSGNEMIKKMEAYPSRFTFEELKALLDLKYAESPQKTEYFDLLTKIKGHFIRNNL